MRPRPHGPAWPDMWAAERLARGGLAPQTVTVNPPAHFDVGCHGPWEEDPARELAVEAEKVFVREALIDRIVHQVPTTSSSTTIVSKSA